LLEETCPQQYAQGNVCCDLSQLETLVSEVKYAKQLLYNCPACWMNYVSHFCAVNCDPNQAMFMNPRNCTDGTSPNGAKAIAISEVQVYVNSNYSESMYRSCEFVRDEMAGVPVVDLMCGRTGTCNASAWLTYLGDPVVNHNSPFKTAYTFITTENRIPGVQALSKKVIPCYYSDLEYNCWCVDCFEARFCPGPPEHVLNSSFAFTLKGEKIIVHLQST
jgi:Niemann-Pick C1 protein